jgi:hypothetical protein
MEELDQNNINEQTKTMYQKAFAEAFVNSKPELINLLKKYKAGINEGSTEIDILDKVHTLLVENPMFQDEFVEFLIAKGYLTDTSENFRNVVAELIAGAVNAIAEMTGKIVETKGKETDLLSTQAQKQSAETLAMIDLIKQEKEAKAKADRNKLILIGGVSVIAILVTAVLAFKK